MTKTERLRQDMAVNPVLFYSPRHEWGCFSNFSDHSVVLPNPWTWEPLTYRTGEVRFHAIKALSEEDHDYVVAAQETHTSASKISFEAKHRGRSIKLRPEWGADVNTFCWYAMLETVTAKAAQHDVVRVALMDTRERHIYEDSPTDDIWGWRYQQSYTGKNLLGRCWMQARDYFGTRPIG